jgi:hypothetical protein
MFPRQLDGRFHAVRQNDELSILIVSCLTNRYTLASFIGWSSFKAVRALNAGVDKDREPEPRRFPMLLQTIHSCRIVVFQAGHPRGRG